MVDCWMLTLSTESSKPKIWGFYVVALWSTAKKCMEIRAARAARVFSLFKPSYARFVALSLP